MFQTETTLLDTAVKQIEELTKERDLLLYLCQYLLVTQDKLHCRIGEIIRVATTSDNISDEILEYFAVVPTRLKGDVIAKLKIIKLDNAKLDEAVKIISNSIE